MTKSEFLERCLAATAEKLNGRTLSKSQVEALTNTVFEEIGGALQRDGAFSVPGFGSFKVGQLSARKGRNPQTGETIDIAASTVVRFKPAKSLKEALDG